MKFKDRLITEVLLSRLERIEAKQDTLLERTKKMAATLDDIVTKVTSLKTVEDSVVALLASIKAKLDAAGQDPVKLQALSDSLDAQSAALTAAVTANTPTP